MDDRVIKRIHVAEAIRRGESWLDVQREYSVSSSFIARWAGATQGADFRRSSSVRSPAQDRSRH
jgi:hypothetical protein